jgi:hypothetical protein
MDKFTLIYNIIHDNWQIIAKHRNTDLTSSIKPLEDMLKDSNLPSEKYKDIPRALELFNKINIAIQEYLDYTRD